MASNDDDEFEAFNAEVNWLTSELTAREEAVPDLVWQLFEVYKTVGDAKFVEWMKSKHEDYLDDRSINYNKQSLMQLALRKYMIMGDD